MCVKCISIYMLFNIMKLNKITERRNVAGEEENTEI